MIEAVRQNFLNPIGLTALLSLIPLIIFYLVKPEPEKEIMPSMAFFTEEKQKGRIQNALKTLKRNKMLLLHIFFILTASAAIANPLIRGLESDGRSVIVIDTSASVRDNRNRIEGFAMKYLGEENTVIAAGSEPEVLGRNIPPEKARKLIRNHQNSGTATDLVSALQLASNYPGRMVVASDMDQTQNGNLEQALNDISSGRTLKVSGIDHRNSHGFVSMSISDGKVTAVVQNFLNRNSTLEVNKPGGDVTLTLGPLSSETVSFSPGPGTFTATLPSDEMPVDNKLYVSLPGNGEIAVKRLGDESRYFRKAIQLINQTKYVEGSSLQGADVYYVSSDYSLSDQDLKRIRNLMEQGDAFIFEPRQNLPEFVPVENRTASREVSVQIRGAMAARFTSSVTGYNVTGSSLSEPEDALVLSENRKVMLYNVDDQTFGREIVYPVFWKNTLLKMTERKTASELNMVTGQEKDFQTSAVNSGKTYTGLTELEDTGFYRADETYAVNLLNADESSPHINTAAQKPDRNTGQDRDPAQKYLSSALAFIALFELVYLSSGGAIQ